MRPYNYRATHDRRCERCERMFLATLADQEGQQFKCKGCRGKPEESVKEGYTRTNNRAFKVATGKL